LIEQYAGRQYIYDTVDDGLEWLHQKYQEDQIKTDGLLMVEENNILAYPGTRHSSQSRTRSWIPRYLELNRLGSELIFCLETNTGDQLMPLRLLGSYFDCVPCRLGHNVALDDAISCICAIYRSREPPPYTASKRITRSYRKALASVRSHLGNPALRNTSEVLCASILLQFFEVSALARLIQTRF
jgi:hypothetical protein